MNLINQGTLLYANKEKTLDYLGTPTPIVGAVNNQEFSDAAKIQHLIIIKKSERVHAK